MSLLRTLNTASDMNTKVRDFVQIARLVASTRGDTLAAAMIAEKSETVPGNVAGVLKSAVGAGTLSDATWASPLSPYGTLISAFLGSLRSVGAFDRMLPDMRNVPLRTRVGAVTTGTVGTIAGEGVPTPISSIALTGGTLDEQKALAIVAITTELAQIAGDPALQLLERELRLAVSAVTDATFVATITNGVA